MSGSRIRTHARRGERRPRSQGCCSRCCYAAALGRRNRAAGSSSTRTKLRSACPAKAPTRSWSADLCPFQVTEYTNSYITRPHSPSSPWLNLRALPGTCGGADLWVHGAATAGRRCAAQPVPRREPQQPRRRLPPGALPRCPRAFALFLRAARRPSLRRLQHLHPTRRFWRAEAVP